VAAGDRMVFYVTDRGRHRTRGPASGSSSGSCKLDQSLTRSERGLDLALYLSRRLAQLLGGDVSYRRATGRCVLLPAGREELSTAPAPREGRCPPLDSSIAMCRRADRSLSAALRARRGVAAAPAPSRWTAARLSGCRPSGRPAATTPGEGTYPARNLRPGGDHYPVPLTCGAVLSATRPTSWRAQPRTRAVWTPYSSDPMLPRCRSCVASRSSRR